MNLPQNLFDGNVNVQTFLCQPNKEIIGEILPYDFNANFKFNTYSEISFTIDRYYNDLFEGKVKVNPYYDLVESLRVIYIRGIGHFIIQDVDEGINENESKSVTCFSLEYATGQKYLENFYVNTGEDNSIEVMYNARLHGLDYNPSEDPYSLINVESDKFDPYQRYYIKQYDKYGKSWNVVEKQVLDVDHFKTFIGENSETTLYIRKYERVRFYWPTKSELSLLHQVFSRIPEWKIGHVDKELQFQERTFSEDRTAVYDFLYNTAAETLDFVMVWDSINGVVNFYKTTEDGVTADEEVETQWNTDVFISRENLASELDIKYSTDDIKTKLKITGSDDLDVRDVNLGQNYILNLSYYNTPLWLGEDLHIKYNQYTNKLVEYTKQYKDLVSARSAAYNEYSDLMNYVPVEPRVMLVGDEFEKLYCVKNKYLPAPKVFDKDKTYYIYKYDNVEEKYVYDTAIPQPKTDQDLKDKQYHIESPSSIDALVNDLTIKLRRYKVDLQDNGLPSSMAKPDDVLFTLEDNNSNSATLRIRINQDKQYKLAAEFNSSETYFSYNPKNDSYTKIAMTKGAFESNKYYTYGDYLVYRTRTDASTGTSNTITFTLKEWVEGKLQANYEGMNLKGFKIKSIGTLGAYFCLVRDEVEKANLEDYGIRLLQEKRDTYTKIFIAQTAGYMNKEGSQCIASDTEPVGIDYADGTKWLDTDGVRVLDQGTNNERSVLPLYKWNGGTKKWEEYNPTADDPDLENYARFHENYTKLGNVQAVLAEKQRIAVYLLNGVAITNRHITNENINSANLLAVAQDHFPNEKITLIEYNKEFGFISFTIGSDTENEYAVYTIDGTPYVAYTRSQGLCLAKMTVIKEATDMNNPDNFTEQELIRLSPFIREDEYSDSNFLLTTYESEEEQMYIKEELLKAGEEELKKICQPKLSFDATMANILAIPEFAPLRNQFKLGNFVRVGIREGYVKRARLLEVQINFDDPSDFNCTFGDLMTTKSEVDKHAELLSMAVQAGKSVASNSSGWQKGADKATELDRRINDGLRDASLSVGAAEGQSITWDAGGIWGRKLVDGTTDQYEPEQFRLINNKLVFSSDGFKTSKAVFGKYVVNGETRWGPLAEYITAETIEGKFISGGSIRIGGNNPGDRQFIVHEDGSVEIGKVVQEGDNTKIQSEYVSQEALDQIDSAYKYSIQIVHTGKAVFSSKADTATMTAKIYRRGEDATDEFKKAGVIIYWEKNPSDENWKATPVTSGDTYSIILDANDIENSAQISCYMDPTDDQIKTIENKYNG